MTQETLTTSEATQLGSERALDMPVLQFVKSTRAAFNAEVALDNDDLVFHFFLPDHLAKYPITGNLKDYWTKRFPEALDQIAQAHFKAKFPQLQAQHIDELGVDSWWMRAYGFADVDDVDDFVEKFYVSFEERLNSKST